MRNTRLLLLLTLLGGCGPAPQDTASSPYAADGKADASTWAAQCDVTVTRPTGWYLTRQCVVEGDATGTSLLPVTIGTRTISTFSDLSRFLTLPSRASVRVGLGQQVVTAKLNSALFLIGDHPYADGDGDGTVDTVDEVIADSETLYNVGSAAQRTQARALLIALNSSGRSGGVWFDETCVADPEICDGTDNDADGSVDEDCACLEVCDGEDNDADGTVDEDQPDGDGDGASCDDCDDADPAVSPGATEVENGVDDDCDGLVDEGTAAYDDDADGYPENAGDCDDADPAVNPAAAEVENGIDDDCDGVVDEGTAAYDDDGDGWSETVGDCDDADPAVSPGATEVENGVDDDCDGLVDEGTAAYDDDGDGYSEDAGDCDDASPSVHPGATEVCNALDDNCDSRIDEGVASLWFRDGDGDGYGARIGWVRGCSQPSGYTNIRGDCDDRNRLNHPRAVEVCGDGTDNNCNNAVDEGC